VLLPPEPGHTRLWVRGWGSPNSDDWRKSLALCLYSVLLPVISLLLTNTISPVRLADPYDWRGFVGAKKKTNVDLLVFRSLWLIYTMHYLPHREKKDQRMGRKVTSIAELADEEIDVLEAIITTTKMRVILVTIFLFCFQSTSLYINTVLDLLYNYIRQCSLFRSRI
jgi:hypothetical protein